MINTNAFFDFTDFQVPLCAVQPTAFVWVREGPLDSNSVNGDRRVRVHVNGPCYLVVVLCGVVFVLGLQRRSDALQLTHYNTVSGKNKLNK